MLEAIFQGFRTYQLVLMKFFDIVVAFFDQSRFALTMKKSNKNENGMKKEYSIF